MSFSRTMSVIMYVLAGLNAGLAMVWAVKGFDNAFYLAAATAAFGTIVAMMFTILATVNDLKDK